MLRAHDDEVVAIGVDELQVGLWLEMHGSDAQQVIECDVGVAGTVVRGGIHCCFICPNFSSTFLSVSHPVDGIDEGGFPRAHLTHYSNPQWEGFQ